MSVVRAGDPQQRLRRVGVSGNPIVVSFGSTAMYPQMRLKISLFFSGMPPTVTPCNATLRPCNGGS